MAWPAAMELLLVGNAISAQRAMQLGLVNEVVPRAVLMETAMRWAREIARNSPVAVQATKRSARSSIAGGSLEEAYRVEDDCAREVYRSADSQEGVRAFFEKREPVWKAG
jgi:enoyl-CoA hydratase/carnithine racemase